MKEAKILQIDIVERTESYAKLFSYTKDTKSGEQFDRFALNGIQRRDFEVEILNCNTTSRGKARVINQTPTERLKERMKH